MLAGSHMDPRFSDRFSQGESIGITKDDNWFENSVDGSHPSENPIQ
jgi:hypothetical protein